MNNGYEVGYGKPPESNRFKKGQSGNPSGRRKGSKNKFENNSSLNSVILAEANRPLKIYKDNKQITTNTTGVIFRSVVVAAAKGEFKSQKLYFEMQEKAEEKEQKKYEEFLSKIIDYKMLCEKKIEYCKRFNLPIPEFIPDPDDIHIDLRTGEVFIYGALTKEEKVQIDWRCSEKEKCKETIVSLETELSNNPDSKRKRAILKEIKHQEVKINIFNKRLPRGK